MAQLFTNNAISLLQGPLAHTDLTFSVTAGDEQLFPQPLASDDWFLVTIANQTSGAYEIIKVISRTGNLFHIDPVDGRGFENTPIYDWPADNLVDHRLTAFTLNRTNTITPGASTTPPVVQVAQVKAIDTLTTTALLRTCKWLVTVIDIAGNRASMCEVMAVYRGVGNSPAFTVYGKIGDNLKYGVIVVQNGLDMTVQVINNDTVDLTTSIVRISAI